MKILLAAFVLSGLILGAKAQPVISAPPTNQTVNAGSAAYFSVAASDGTNELTFQWTNALGAIPDATNAAYAFDDVGANQAGVYGVIVTSTNGSTTSAATLTVLQGTIVNLAVSGFATGPSNVVVELFDHDKPATVENFLHYIRSGAYSNMFLDRLLPGFVLQTGDFAAKNRTNTRPNLNVTNYISIGSTYVGAGTIAPPLPEQVNNEFYAGPVVSNRTGTLALALPSGNINGGNAAFFFNLVDNSELDSTADGGPFTVFGRVLAGSAVLDYFNDTNNFFKPTPPSDLNFTTNIFNGGIFDYDYLDSTDQQLTDLPENFLGTNIPGNANLFFLDFSFPDGQPALDTTPPTLAVTSPTNGEIVPNSSAFTVLGAAQDNMALALVHGSMRLLNGPAGTAPVTGYADSVTNGSLDQWSLDLGAVNPGLYDLVVSAQDGAGNWSQAVTNKNIIVSAISIQGLGTVGWTDQTTKVVNPDAVGSYMKLNEPYVLQAHPGRGQLFANWTVGTAVSVSADVPVEMQSGLLLTANFVSNSIPNSIVLTYPPVGGSATNGTNLVIQGTLKGLSNTPVAISCLVSSLINYTPSYWLAVGPAQTNSFTNAWSVTESNTLSPGKYLLQVTARDAKGNTTLMTNQFTVLTPLALATNGPGTISLSKGPAGSPPTVGNYLVANQTYTVTAKPDPGAAFYCWTNGASTSLNPEITFTMTAGMALTATFVPNNLPSAIAFVFPKAGGLVTTGDSFQLTGTIKSSVTAAQIFCQFFNNGAAVTGPLPATINGNSWSVATNLPAGRNYTVLATLYNAQGQGAFISENFSVLAKLSVATACLVPSAGAPGTASASPAAAGMYYQAGSDVVLTAKANPGYLFAYWLLGGATNTANPVQISVSSNETVTACFSSNYYQNVSGTYDGLFYATNAAVNATDAGYFTMVVGTSGAATFQLVFPGRTDTFKGVLPFNGQQSGGRENSDGSIILFALSVDLTNGTDSVTGQLQYAYNTSDFDFGIYAWSAEIVAYRVAPHLGAGSNAVPGPYVLTIPGNPAEAGSQPGGNGYASYTISATTGDLKLVGSLADGTTISQSTGITPNGVWPFYAPLYKTAGVYQGIILGWQTNFNPASGTNATAANAGQILAWSKAAKAGGYYNGGFSVTTNSETSPFVPPTPLSVWQITFGGGTLASPMTNLLSVTPAGLLAPVGTTNTVGVMDKLAITSFGKTSGALAGQFVNPATGKTIFFKGAFASPDEGGSGYFLDTDNQSGWFQISPVP